MYSPGFNTTTSDKITSQVEGKPLILRPQENFYNKPQNYKGDGQVMSSIHPKTTEHSQTRQAPFSLIHKTHDPVMYFGSFLNLIRAIAFVIMRQH